MKMNMDALKALELKLAEYSKANGAIAEHGSSALNLYGVGNGCGACTGSCLGQCQGTCNYSCSGSCSTSR